MAKERVGKAKHGKEGREEWSEAHVMRSDAPDQRAGDGINRVQMEAGRP